jgi:predicted MFS family arabinose efflux permease
MGLSAGGAIHLMPFLTENGMSRSGAAVLLSVMGIASFSARVATGALVDRFHAALVCALAVLAQAVAYFLLGAFRTSWALPAIFLWGFGQGSEVVCLGYSVSRFFGLKSYGRIMGVLNPIWGIGVALGPPLFGWLRDRTGGYAVSFFDVGGLALASAVLLFLTARHPFRDGR